MKIGDFHPWDWEFCIIWGCSSRGFGFFNSGDFVEFGDAYPGDLGFFLRWVFFEKVKLLFDELLRSWKEKSAQNNQKPLLLRLPKALRAHAHFHFFGWI